LFGTTSIQKKPLSKRPVDLLPTSPTSPPLPYPQAPKSPSFQERNPFAELGISTNKLSIIKQESRGASPVTAWPTFEPTVPKPAPYEDSPATKDDLDEDWGDFADFPAEHAVKALVKPTSGIEADAWAWDEADRVNEKSTSKVLPPPNQVFNCHIQKNKYSNLQHTSNSTFLMEKSINLGILIHTLLEMLANRTSSKSSNLHNSCKIIKNAK
jgi:hypothetical protein